MHELRWDSGLHACAPDPCRNPRSSLHTWKQGHVSWGLFMARGPPHGHGRQGQSLCKLHVGGPSHITMLGGWRDPPTGQHPASSEAQTPLV